MSDMYNNYNSDPNNGDEYNQNGENYSYYSGGNSPQKPKKPKSHTALKAIALILSVGIGCAGGIQLYRFMGDSNIKLTDESEKNQEETSKAENSSNGSEKTPSFPEPQNLPGLFDIASRTDAKYLPDIVDEIMPSVAGISSTFEVTYSNTNSISPWGWGFQSQPETREMVGTGTGIVMTEDGYIVTNAHVVYTDEYNAGEAKEVSVLFSDEKEYDAKIIAFDVETDLAVLKIDASGFTPATFGNSDELRVGEIVIAVGNPLGFELFGSVTSGIVSALNRQISINEKNMTLIQTDAAINSGNSGGPLLNSCGQVIGINSAKMSSSYGTASVEGLGFAIPINDAKAIIDDLISKGYVSGRPQIGVSTVDITETYSSYLGLPMGVYVRMVAEGGAAEEAGIKEGDVIIGINDEAIATADELNNIKNQFKAGDTVTLKIYRNGQDLDFSLVLQDAHDEMNPEQSEEETKAADSDDNSDSPIQPR